MSAKAAGLAFAAACLLSPAMAQEQTLPSQVCRWNAAAPDAAASNAHAAMLQGSTRDLASLEIEPLTLAPGNAAIDARDAHEQMFIVKFGTLQLKLAGGTFSVGPGSVAVILPGDACELASGGDAPAVCHRFRYTARAAADQARGVSAGGSFVVDWKDVPFHPSEIGGRRENFDRATAMFERFDMHVTTLNAGLASHPPHTHRAEEIILVIKGDVEMQLGDVAQRGSAGDLFFVASEIPHGLHNVGSGPAEYYAIQWR